MAEFQINTGCQAVEYARNGFALCPIPLGSKGPKIKGWNLPGNAITNENEAQKLNGNVGLLHAYSGTMALDIDDFAQAEEWLEFRGLNLRGFFATDDYVEIVSGREGSAKLLYRLPDGVDPMPTQQIRNAAGEVILEFRCADTVGNSVQDVLPPSIHPSTEQPYRWRGPGDFSSLPTVPETLLAVWKEQLGRSGKPSQKLPPQSTLLPSNLTSNGLPDCPENRAELTRLLNLVIDGRRIFDPNSGRGEWLPELWSIAALGPWAHDAAREWSEEGETFDPAQFELDWNSFDPLRQRGVTEASFFAKLSRADVQHSFVRRKVTTKAAITAPPPPLPTTTPTLTPAPATTLMSLPHQLPEGSAVQELNRVVGFAHDWGGKPTLFRTDGDGRVYPCTREDTRALLANRFVKKRDGSQSLLFPIWEKSPDRRTVAKVVFDPSGGATDRNGEPIQNLWQGFSFKPKPGKFELMFWHLHSVICRGDEGNFHYLLGWMAHLVQCPWEAPGVVVVLRSSREGTGKTTVIGWLAQMLGIHGLMLSEPTQLLGRFNSHLETLCFVGLNELGWAGDKDATAKLKSIITDPTITIERKHGGVYSVPNVLHIMASSNNDWVVPAGDRARRFFVLDVDPSRVGETAYFNALHAEAQNGGVAALMNYLLGFDLTKVNLRAVPVTDALREQQEISLPLQAQWALDLADRAIENGHAGIVTFGRSQPTRILYDDYCSFVRERHKQPIGCTAFGKWLTKIGLETERTSSHRLRILPTPTNFAQLIRQSAGIHR